MYSSQLETHDQYVFLRILVLIKILHSAWGGGGGGGGGRTPNKSYKNCFAPQNYVTSKYRKVNSWFIIVLDRSRV